MLSFLIFNLPNFPTQEEMAIYHAFTNEALIAKVVSFMSLEEKKGKDAFSGNKFHLFHVSF